MLINLCGCKGSAFWGNTQEKNENSKLKMHFFAFGAEGAKYFGTPRKRVLRRYALSIIALRNRGGNSEPLALKCLINHAKCIFFEFWAEGAKYFGTPRKRVPSEIEGEVEKMHFFCFLGRALFCMHYTPFRTSPMGYKCLQNTKIRKKSKKNAFSCEIIWSCQKKAVLLHAFSPCGRLAHTYM